eukprot:CAMPEP_0178409916 /NCGR_PEP_ID=MMETSP0689_2-20121128/20708_1 /TAXON_ID=160604 /ORGANISM="Amphidinium massartii, Strain CS-259" /LENGTH=122 /DNA_ID=CAMNT_0020031071 /DNA_START=80 /DNA_END=448 /DNA_ORIENTATION=+
MQIFVKTLSGQVFTLEVEAAEEVACIKDKIYDATGIPSFQQGLSYSGKQLQDDLALADYNVNKESMLMLNMRLRGGCCWFFSFMILCLIAFLIAIVPCTCGTSACLVPMLLPPLLILPCFCL